MNADSASTHAQIARPPRALKILETVVTHTVEDPATVLVPSRIPAGKLEGRNQ